ncbi:MAG: N-acetylglucosamine-6-phosphate deacetylase [Pyrinomonadaceae bacterium]
MFEMDINDPASDNTLRKSILLRNADIVLPDQVLSAASFLVRDGRIVSVGPSSEQPEICAHEPLNLDGLRIYPGFIDVHIHGAVGVDTMSASKDDLDRVSRFLAAHGVTAWLPTLVPAPARDYARAISAIEALMQQQANEEVQSGARVLGVHYEGPFVSTSQCGALRSAYFKSFSSASDLESLPTPNPAGAVRMMTVAPEIEGGVELISQLVARGWIVAIGHTRAGIEILDQAFAAGARHMTHFMNAMPPLHHRAPGPVGWGLAHDEVTCDLIADGIHLDRLVLKILLRTRGADRLTMISDAIAAAGQGDGDYQIWGETIAVRNGRTSNAQGSIAGSVITMLAAARMMQSVGASDVEVARMTSTNPARLLGIDRDRGSIETGKRADLVALDQTGAVQLTIIAGEVVLQS